MQSLRIQLKNQFKDKQLVMQFLMYFNCNAKFNIALFAKIQACIRTLDRYQSHNRVRLPWLKIAFCRTMEN